MTHMSPKYGYGARGRRIVARKRKKSKRYTLIGAMGFNRMIAPLVLPRAMKLKDWIRWIKYQLLPQLAPYSIVIWDNLNIHYNFEARLALEKFGHLVLFQSRYSPDLNPIEKAWSKLKASLRRFRPRGAKALRAAIAHAWSTITPKDIDGYFASAVENAWEPLW